MKAMTGSPHRCCSPPDWPGRPAQADRGDRIERRWDARGDRIDRRWTGARLGAAHGHARAAARLDRRGDRIDARFDRIGARREARFDRRH